jgi:hypothetical protein
VLGESIGHNLRRAVDRFGERESILRFGIKTYV